MLDRLIPPPAQVQVNQLAVPVHKGSFLFHYIQIDAHNIVSKEVSIPTSTQVLKKVLRKKPSVRKAFVRTQNDSIKKVLDVCFRIILSRVTCGIQ